MALDREIRARVDEWMGEEYDEETRAEIRALVESGNEAELVDRFFQDLDFGTGGLRGVIGAGTNRMNVYTVRKATQGLADTILEKGGEGAARRGVAVCYDSRRNSDLFALETALVLAGNGIRACLFEEMRPTPVLSFAVRELGCIAGVNVTASHNPPEYNGYKAYWADGAQVTPPWDEEIIAHVRKVASLSQVRRSSREDALSEGLLRMVRPEVDGPYFDAVASLSLNREINAELGSDFKIVYTPLHGCGRYSVVTALERFGFTDVHVVPEQAEPDPDFPTVEAPNPEVRSSMKLAIELAERIDGDLILGTDADTDRIGLGLRDEKGDFVLLNGNQIGALITNYYAGQLAAQGKTPDDAVVIKTIVTTDLIPAIGAAYGCESVDVLTGFKYIGEKMKLFEEARARGEKSHTFVCGGEESFGFLAGDFVRDKDAVISACLLAEAAAFVRKQGHSLWQELEKIYERHGYYGESLRNVVQKGKAGKERIEAIMAGLRADPPRSLGGSAVIRVDDLESGIRRDGEGRETGRIDLPSSNVLQFHLADGAKVTARPSGTEPKIKFYFQARADVTDGLAAARRTVDERLKVLEKELLVRVDAIV